MMQTFITSALILSAMAAGRDGAGAFVGVLCGFGAIGSAIIMGLDVR